MFKFFLIYGKIINEIYNGYLILNHCVYYGGIHQSTEQSLHFRGLNNSLQGNSDQGLVNISTQTILFLKARRMLYNHTRMKATNYKIIKSCKKSTLGFQISDKY